jgi:uroporphyrinogen decarboxylase
MNSRERVLTALTRSGVPDRVPLQFDLCRSLTDAFGEKLDIPVHYTTSYFEDLTYRLSANELRIAMGSDCVMVGGGLPRGYSHPVPEEGQIINEFGMLMEQGPLYMQTIEPPLQNATTVADVENHPFPDAYAEGRFDDARKYTEKYKNDYCIIGDLELTMYEMSWHMVGMEKFLLDMAMGEDYIFALIDRVMEFSVGIAKQLVDVGVDAIWFGDDFGAQNGMLISPAMWRNIFKPRYAELWREVKSINPDLIICYHTDGAVSPILGDLAEIGMEVFNPVQPNVPGHDPQELKDQFGDKFAFWGAIDQQDLLPNGTPEQIEAEVAKRIRILGAGGGYMSSPAHMIQSDVSMENVEAFIAAVKKHGVYT